MKKIYLGILTLIVVLFIGGCSTNEKADDETIVESVLQQQYKIDNFKINNTESKKMPKDKNASNGKTYDDVNSIKANFTYKDRIFDLDLLYNYEGGENYTILYSYTDLDKENSIDVPLESKK